MIADEAGEYDDWLEIVNPWPGPLSLAGLALSDDLDDPAPWPLPAVELAAGEFLLLWCDEDQDQGPLHADFTLAAGGEKLALFLLDGGAPYVVDSVAFGPQETDVAYGRIPDTHGAWQILPQPTPGASNTGETAATPAGPRGLVSAGLQPNPAGDRATLRFALGPAAAGPVHARVYDLRGRLVHGLLAGELAAGDHTATWDRRDLRGRRAPAGVYLVRLVARGSAAAVELSVVD